MGNLIAYGNMHMSNQVRNTWGATKNMQIYLSTRKLSWMSKVGENIAICNKQVKIRNTWNTYEDVHNYLSMKHLAIKIWRMATKGHLQYWKATKGRVYLRLGQMQQSTKAYKIQKLCLRRPDTCVKSSEIYLRHAGQTIRPRRASYLFRIEILFMKKETMLTPQ